MAKMFYSLEEAALKLQKSEEDVRQMASNGEITEFRDGDKLIFKVDQIDLLATSDDVASDMSSMIALADTGGQSAIAPTPTPAPASPAAPSPAPHTDPDVGSTGISDFGLEGDIGSGLGSGLGGSGGGSSQGLSDFDNAFTLEDSGTNTGEPVQEASGISVFDADELESADPAAQTQMSDGGIEGGLNLDQLGSGSGLMDLTRESDDTSLGAEGLLDELYQGDDAAPEETVSSGDLFEGTPSAPDMEDDSAGVPVAAAAEAYDPTWSGLTGGLAIGMIAASAVGAGVIIMTIAGAVPPFMYSLEFGPLSVGMVWALIPAAIGVVFGVVGMTMSKAG